jgi:hypothetical protein
LLLMLSCVGVVGELGPSEIGVWGSAFPVSAIKTAVAGHLDNGLVFVMTWRVNRSVRVAKLCGRDAYPCNPSRMDQ